MFKKLVRSSYFKEILMLGILTAFCFSLSMFRIYYTGYSMYIFLNWNLFLAFIPWLLSSFIAKNATVQQHKLLLLPLLSIWLLFFPNAPYILTDLFHLKSRANIPIWFDLILLFSFAWTGLLFGLLSLRDIEKILRDSFGSLFSNLTIVFVLFLSAFGIYLGRFLRWNSWDIIQEPMGLFYDIASRFIHPFDHPRTWGMTIILGVFLNIVFWSYKNIHSEP